MHTIFARGERGHGRASRAEGRITDEGIARLRARIGVPEPHPLPPYYTLPDASTRSATSRSPTATTIRSGATPSTAPKTRWEGAIAPPPLVGGDTLIGEDEVTAVAPEQRELMKGDPLRGVHAFYAASAREWWAPLYPQRRVFRRNALVAALDKPSEFAGRAVHEWTAQVFRDETGTLLSGQYRLMVRTEREKAREKKKYDAVELAPYTDEQIDEIEAQYARERARGAEPRWWEDVHEGDEVGPMVKGPLTVTDMICWHAGMGMGLYGVQPLRLGYQNRRRIPRFFHRDPQNVPDVMQRVHWDPEFARRSGNPTTFDYGRMRETWLIHLCTDWMGDDAWLWKLDCEFRRFNYVGDTQWLRGRVVRKLLAAGDRPAVDLELEAVNQRGEVTTPGHATILLPSREHGAVRLPDPPGGARRPAGRARRRSRRSSRADERRAGYASVAGLAVALDGGVLRVTLDRPDKRNAIDDEMMLGLVDALTVASTDDRVRVILLDGAGDHFCGGADIVARNRERRRRAKPRAGQHPAPAARRRRTGSIPLLLEVQVPVVCKVRGCAAGIGFSLALAADFTIAADDARVLGAVRRARVHARQRRDVVAAAPRRRGAGARAAAARPRALGRRGGGVGRDPRARCRPASSTRAVDELVAQLATGPTVALGLTKWLLHAGRDASLEQQLAQRGVRARAVVAHRRLPRGHGRVPRAARAALRGR